MINNLGEATTKDSLFIHKGNMVNSVTPSLHRYIPTSDNVAFTESEKYDWYVTFSTFPTIQALKISLLLYSSCWLQICSAPSVQTAHKVQGEEFSPNFLFLISSEDVSEI